MADDYGIVIGTSHAEPMLRNNVREWDRKTTGPFNYLNNKDAVYQYWEKRIQETGKDEVIYSMGMRGEHDSGMEGVKSTKEAVPLLERIFADQRNLLQRLVNQDIGKVPQAFTAYKEVLDIYDNGLSIPEDITIVWPDDNYGYIQRLGNQEEQSRTGGTGVYYHASYWGRPHDYLWLGTQHPALIVEEMMKAYRMEANQIWVLNVGDIKPLEYQIQLFLDMAYDSRPFINSNYVKKHLDGWCSELFGHDLADRVSAALWQHYALAFERKPEFMGWSQTEPTTATHYSEYNHFYYNDEASKRLEAYKNLCDSIEVIRNGLNNKNDAAYYQLVYYPIITAAEMNKKFLFRDKAYWYGLQGRLSATEYAGRSIKAQQRITEETSFFNTKLANGKWNGIMSMVPRNLPVFQSLDLPVNQAIAVNVPWDIAPEGMIKRDSSLLNGDQLQQQLPAFNLLDNEKYFVDVYLTKAEPLKYQIKASADWILLSSNGGYLEDTDGNREQRFWVSINTRALPQKVSRGYIEISDGIHSKRLEINVKPAKLNLADTTTVVERNQYISMHATSYLDSHKGRHGNWMRYEGLGSTGKSLVASVDSPITENRTFHPDSSAWITYRFYNTTETEPEVHIYTLPIHPLNLNYSVRYAVSLDNGPVEIVDSKTFGRSEEWKINVLRNQAERVITGPKLKAGSHTLKIYMVDPGVMLDHILIDLGGLKSSYGVIPETK